MAALSRTSHLVLGLVGRGERTGYEIKRAIDRAARFFWAVSYGQLYPELKRLEAAGLLRSRGELTGGRRRTAYELTAAGEDELSRWLAANDDLQFELRSEALLKLFLARDRDPDRQLAIVRAFRAQGERRVAQIGAAEPPRELGRRLREYGLRMSRMTVEWCDELERAIVAGELEDGGDGGRA